MTSRKWRVNGVQGMLLTAFLTIFVSGCTSAAAPKGPAAITGPIVARDLTISIGSAPSIHVKETASSECGIIFLVRSSTRIFRRTADGQTINASQSDLNIGRRVSVWTDLILESCPGQGNADAVEIIE